MSNKEIKLRKFLSYYKPYRGLLAAVLISAIVSAALALIFPMLVRYITKDILESGMTGISSEILQIGALMLAIIVAQTILSLFCDYKGHDMGAKIERDMRQELFSHYQKLSFNFFDNQQTGQLMSRLTSDLLDLAELLHHGPENIVIYGTQFIGSLIVLLSINHRLALIICSILPFMAVYSFIFYTRLQKSYSENRRRIGEVNSRAEENLSGIRTVKSFANEKLETSKFQIENTRFYKGRADIYKNEAFHYSVMEFFFTPLITVAIVVFGGLWIADGTLELPNLLVFILYAAYLTAPVPKLAFMVQQYQDGLSGYRRFREIMETEPEIIDADNASELKITKGEVAFIGVAFHYDEGHEYILNNVDLNVSEGETIAIVGRSGVGKTTLCSLIPRFYDAIAGKVLIDGIDIRNITLNSLRSQIGVVSQETFLFSGSIMENILYGRPGAPESDAIEAAKKANAHEFIKKLPNGYYTNIGQRGIKLSGGQRQRISIARVFLKDPKILIFDEATSALDYESERAVMESLEELSKGRTTFIIAHRLSTVKTADRIIVLTNDGIVEQGTHEQLYALNGIYSGLYGAQPNI